MGFGFIQPNARMKKIHRNMSNILLFCYPLYCILCFYLGQRLYCKDITLNVLLDAKASLEHVNKYKYNYIVKSRSRDFLHKQVPFITETLVYLKAKHERKQIFGYFSNI